MLNITKKEINEISINKDTLVRVDIGENIAFLTFKDSESILELKMELGTFGYLKEKIIRAKKNDRNSKYNVAYRKK